GLTVTPGEGGGIRFTPFDDKGCSSVRSVRLDGNYPYLVWEVTAMRPVLPKTYKCFSVGILDPKAVNLSVVGDVRPGIYSSRPFAAAPDTNRLGASVFVASGANAVDISSIRMVKVPEQHLEMSSPSFAEKKHLDPGDPLTFTLTLKEPADDVVVSFYKNDMFYFGHVMTIGGRLYCWLKAKDGTDRKVWARTIPFENCVYGAWNKEDPIPLPAGAFLVEATVKRVGKPDQSFWTCNNVEFKMQLERP
ncbi:MAG: hypothetical protein PHR35_15170, partial [Kiritimatiellae bacterium]|nr:hypothetical protein [Kiritimatiellia bacterium]